MMMQHINHSATPSPGPPSQQQQSQQPPTSMHNIADLEAKMEAALVLTCLGGASPAPPAYPTVQAHPGKTTHQVAQGQNQNDGVQRTTSSSSDDDQANATDVAPIYSSSDGYDGSGEEEGNKSPEPADEDSPNTNDNGTTAPAPRRFLKGGKRGKGTNGSSHGGAQNPARSSSPWGSKAKNLADAALEQYQAAASEAAAPTAPSSSTTSSSKSRFRTSLKRSNSKTRMKWQAS